MLTATVIGMAYLSQLPLVWAVDFAALPPRAPFEFTFSITVELANGDKVSKEWIISKDADPEDAHGCVLGTFQQMRGWQVEEHGLVIVFAGKKDNPVRRIVVEGDGPKPQVRVAFGQPKKK